MSKIALITGATSGIGLATAKELGKSGYDILINGIVEKEAEKAVKDLKAEGINVEFFKADVTDENCVNDMFKKIGEKYDKLDVLVNCAGGLGGRSRFENMTTEFYRKVMGLNLDSVFFVSRAAIPFLKKGENPSIINFASIASYNAGGPGAGIYGTAKAGVLTMTRALAKDLVEYGIRVNAVSPGTIDTPFHAATKREIMETWKNGILMKRFGEASEVATVIEFLVSDKASYLTGEVIQINGGQDFR
ncbi:SDR family oxidoreductase [Clostridium sp. cel8]|jgi:meso-butanediol dehydrogenase / (S,S)-butanediol dehydrogenase / diacetyl reductase|uniref:SDR family NAD(P)-dependent oxidoreductase n=1 Tax=unclassified Clostridium TaxID=2614128 RepID=UPI0015F672C7|nr:SDR family NAD(P)-dependent oxidoreductase [Clostridium sp. cel8]MBA5850790.1 SDR family oxidoreductase [Clostridium sp. cel8]